MKVYNIDNREYVECPQKVKEFIDEIRKLYLKYNMSITHEDQNISFIIETPYQALDFHDLRNSSIKGFKEL